MCNALWSVWHRKCEEIVSVSGINRSKCVARTADGTGRSGRSKTQGCDEVSKRRNVYSDKARQWTSHYMAVLMRLFEAVCIEVSEFGLNKLAPPSWHCCSSVSAVYQAFHDKQRIVGQNHPLPYMFAKFASQWLWLLLKLKSALYPFCMS